MPPPNPNRDAFASGKSARMQERIMNAAIDLFSERVTDP
jgi:hypothetical protein